MTVKRYLMTGMTPNPGGVEAYIMNLVRHIDPEKVQFDYLVNYEEVIAYEQELRSRYYPASGEKKTSCRTSDRLQEVL